MVKVLFTVFMKGSQFFLKGIWYSRSYSSSGQEDFAYYVVEVWFPKRSSNLLANALVLHELVEENANAYYFWLYLSSAITEYVVTMIRALTAESHDLTEKTARDLENEYSLKIIDIGQVLVPTCILMTDPLAMSFVQSHGLLGDAEQIQDLIIDNE